MGNNRCENGLESTTLVHANNEFHNLKNLVVLTFGELLMAFVLLANKDKSIPSL